MRFRHLIALLVLSAGVPLGAWAQVNQFEVGTLYQSAAVVGTDIDGADLAGLTVEWTFADLSTGQGSWGAIGGGSCGINSGGVRLFVGCDDNTKTSTWTLLNLTGATLSSVRLRGASIGVVFDCGWMSDECATVGDGLAGGSGWGTLNSFGGTSHERTGGSHLALTGGVYRNLVGIGGAAPVGDLFEEFTLLLNGMATGTSYQFRTDVEGVSPLAPQTVVPEPSTWSTLLIGVSVVLWIARRWRGTRSW